MEIEHYIRKIVDDGNREEMEQLSEMLNEVINIIKRYDKNCYKEYVMKLYEMAYGDELTEKIAIDIVKKMQPYGMHWDIQETERIQRERGLNDINPADFFAVMNSAYNDFRDIFGDNIEMYIRWSIAFINDEDAVEDKVLKYFLTIPE